MVRRTIHSSTKVCNDYDSHRQTNGWLNENKEIASNTLEWVFEKYTIYSKYAHCTVHRW
jgi:hypothetical protein